MLFLQVLWVIRTNRFRKEKWKMKIEEIRGIAKKRDVKTGKMKKGEIIRAIQMAEQNPMCFDTAHAAECGQANCLWLEDCK